MHMSMLIGLLLIFFLILDIILVVIAIIILLKEDRGDYKRCKCSKCGHEFTYDKSKDIVNFEYSGKCCRVVECPRCKDYSKI